MKDLIISKELISEVLDIKIEDIVDFRIFMNELFYYQKLLARANCQGKISKHRDSIQQSINIYEFAFKCKEWALSKEYVINSYSKYKLDGYNCDIYCNDGEIDEDFTSNTEVEAIIKACEWILKEIKAKD